MGCVGARAGRGVPGSSQAVPGDGFLKGIRYQNGSPLNAQKSPFLQHPNASPPSWPEGKGCFSVVGFGAIWAALEHFVAVFLMSTAWALIFRAPELTDPIVCEDISSRGISERTLIGKLISSSSPLRNVAFPKRTSFLARVNQIPPYIYINYF